MPAKEEKEKRKQMLAALQKQAEEEFEQNLPMERGYFTKLFDYLDEELGSTDCDDTNALTRSFLKNLGINNIENVLNWLADNGGCCDCEILANVEELFE